MDGVHLKKPLLSLCNPAKGKILLKQNLQEPNFNDLAETISLNLDFKRSNIRCTMIPRQGNVAIKPLDGMDDPTVMNERKVIIQTKAVKWMKSSV